MANDPDRGTWTQVIVYFSVAIAAVICLVVIVEGKPMRRGYYYWPSATACGVLVVCAIVLAVMKRRR